MKINHILSVPILLLIVYLCANLIVPTAFKGEVILMANSILWTIILTAAVLLLVENREISIWQTDGNLIGLVSSLAVFRLLLSVFGGFFVGFGSNTNMWTTGTVTACLSCLLLPFLAVELSRAYLVKIMNNWGSSKLFFISLFFTLIGASVPTYANVVSLQIMCEFLVRIFIPALAINLVASILSFFGGLKANLLYMGMPAFFTWFSPILPNTPWQVQSMITTAAATLSLLVLEKSIKSPLAKRCHRIPNRARTHLPCLVLVTLAFTIAMWSSIGFLGFSSAAIVGGSMEPNLRHGDVAISIPTPPGGIKIGDVIQFRDADVTIVHRVCDAYIAGGLKWFVTKGDANIDRDNAINEQQVTGKVIFTIPKLGLLRLILNDLIATTLHQISSGFWSWFAANSVCIEAILVAIGCTGLLIECRQS